MIGRLNHVAIVVPDVAAASATYRVTLGARVSEPCPLPAHGVTVVFVVLPNTKIELLEPLGPTSPVKAFIRRDRKDFAKSVKRFSSARALPAGMSQGSSGLQWPGGSRH